MNASVNLEIVGLTDVGQVRDHNEDFLRHDVDLGIAVLADGMGGMNAGEVASAMTVHLLMETLIEARGSETGDAELEDSAAAVTLLGEAIEKANNAVFHVSQTQPQCQGMGTTVVASLFLEDKMIVGHIGDSRMYRFRDQRLTQVTRDHSLVQEMLDKGLVSKEQARSSSQKNVVTRALGVMPKLDVEVHDYETRSGDTYLMCSDGLTDLVTDADIETSLRTLGADLNVLAKHLVDLANAAGGKDNISIILARLGQPGDAAPSLWRRLLNWFE